MSTANKTLIIFLAGFSGLVTQPDAFAVESAENQVRCTEIGFSQSVETGDSEFFASFLDEDARFISNTVLRGAEEVASAWAVFFTESGPQLAWRPYLIEVAASGDLALSRGPYRATGKNEEGQLVESWGLYNSVWRKKPDGKWKIIFDAGNPGENQVTDEMKALIDQPIENCDLEMLRKQQTGQE